MQEIISPLLIKFSSEYEDQAAVYIGTPEASLLPWSGQIRHKEGAQGMGAVVLPVTREWDSAQHQVLALGLSVGGGLGGIKKRYASPGFWCSHDRTV